MLMRHILPKISIYDMLYSPVVDSKRSAFLLYLEQQEFSMTIVTIQLIKFPLTKDTDLWYIVPDGCSALYLPPPIILVMHKLCYT